MYRIRPFGADQRGSRRWVTRSVVAGLACASGIAALGAPASSSVRTPSPFAFVQLAAGAYHTCGLTSAGTVFCWGSNNYGQLGDGTLVRSTVPKQVVTSSMGEGVVQITAGGDDTCAVTHSGGAWCWGQNTYGQLGDGTTANSDQPVLVGKSLVAGVRGRAVGPSKFTDDSNTAAETGGDHTCVLQVGGTLWCFGENNYGQLGNGTYKPEHLPVEVVAAPISASTAHVAPHKFTDDANTTKYSVTESDTCALQASGQAYCFGANTFGQLGNGTTKTSPYPSLVKTTSIGTVAGIAAGINEACALAKSGAVWCWGQNNYGQLGNGTTRNASVPVEVKASTTASVRTLFARPRKFTDDANTTKVGYYYALAETKAGTAYSWGWNNYGELGTGNTANATTPVPVKTVPGGAITQLAAGWGQACLLNMSHEAWCWGLNSEGQLGTTTPHAPESTVPLEVEMPSGPT